MVPIQKPESSRPAEVPALAAAAAPESARSAPAAPANSAAINSAAGDYVLSTSDTLEMTIFRENDLATRSRVGSDGTVQLPLLGDVKVAGMTIREARELIRKKYDADYLVNPQVYLNVIDYAQRKFTILGQVTKPGSYEFPGGKPLSLLQAVGIAGGFTRTADRAKVIVKRTTEGDKEEAIKLNAKKMAGEGKGSFELQPGDVITVGESWF
ncbi:MAG: polysaccharide biosynthesis/export family protein [Chthoniobacteraceae bacterium]